MKKLLSLILALMMCLSMLPATAEYGVIGGADGPTEIFVASEMPAMTLPGDLAAQAIASGRRVESEWKITEMAGIDLDDEALTAAVKELVESISLRIAQQEESFESALAIGETEVLTADVANAADTTYISSNLLGGTIAVRGEEAEGLASRLLDMMVQMEMLTEDDVATLQYVLESFTSTQSLSDTALFGNELSLSDLLTMDYSAVLNVMNDVMQKAEIVESPTVPKTCDPAVAGIKLSMTNDDLARFTKACIQVLRDNPTLMRFVAKQLGMYTEEQLPGLWESLYSDLLTEEEFRAYMQSFESVLDEIDAELDGTQLLDGTYDIMGCYDAEGQIVYMVLTLPIYTEIEMLYGEETYIDIEDEQPAETTDAVAETESAGTTTVLSLEYSRQTLAEGVSHVVNFFVDEESITIDALVKDNTAHIAFSEQGVEPITLDLAWADGTISAVLTIKSNEQENDTIAFEGTYICTEETYKLAGKLTYTETSTSIAGLPVQWDFAVSFSADYVRNGVDFEGVIHANVAFDDVNLALQGTTHTTDPAESIVTADALRPAEMDDETFTSWFVMLMNNFNAWTGTVLMALPESLLTILLSGTM